MLTLDRILKLFVLACLAAGLTLAGCAGKSAGTSQRSLKHLTRRSSQEIAPFTRSHLPSVVGNNMHESHFAAEVKCGVCHVSTDPLPPDRAQEVCLTCHADQKVSKTVWSNHCLACHYFTDSVRKNARNPAELTKILCLRCHADQDPEGGHLYASKKDPTGEMVLCDHCHRPHESTAPAAIDLCVECHKEMSQARHPRGTDAKCSICHKPHSPELKGDQICITCHGQPKDIMVHKIEKHPKDCLRCHKAHFTTIEIKTVCTDCHENLVYREERGGPAKHKDCENCHRLADWGFKGTSACSGCHSKQAGTALTAGTPSQHKRCLTCHIPHTWRTSFERNCVNCHNTSKVLEHNVPYHPKNCKTCHNPHNVVKIPKSGNCDGCHMPGGKVPPFGTSGPSQHRECENCHAPDQLQRGKFAFAGVDSSCTVCHTEAKSGVEWSKVPQMHTDCLNCHGAHTFKLVDRSVSCEVCHADQVALMPNDSHKECFNCHTSDHTLKFVGTENSCQLCHADIVANAPDAMHQDCSNCHKMDHSVKFVGMSKSCEVCHSDLPELHKSKGHAQCLDCHAPHTFKSEVTLCAVCHTDKAKGHFEGRACLECHFFTAKHPAAPNVSTPPAAQGAGK